ncbi:MAG: 2Fe-2S iron-sulfur cluster binding domain-containing protein, partial [Candidatus Cloacimonetes bacterium]|nr:2Fe-2S iron-sulfur cluster binding domain-containing protein [Candidatus Cloacimonadota bacterium]
MIDLKFKVNGKEVAIKVEDSKRLLDILRDELGLTGTKEGCGIGECGACTVIMNGDAVCS